MSAVSPPPDVGSGAGAATAPASNTSAPNAERRAAVPSGPVAAPDLADIRPLDVSGALQILIAEVRAALVEELAGALTEARSPTEVSTTGADDAGAFAGAENPATANAGTAANTETGAGVEDVNNAAGAANAASVATVAGVATAAATGAHLGSVENAHAFVVNAAAEIVDGPVPAARSIVDLVLRSLPETFEPEVWSVALPKMELALQTGIQRAVEAVSAWRDVPPAVVEAARTSGSLAQSLIDEDPPYPLWPPPEWVGMAPRLALLWRRRRALKRRLVDPDYQAAMQREDPNGTQERHDPDT